MKKLFLMLVILLSILGVVVLVKGIEHQATKHGKLSSSPTNCSHPDIVGITFDTATISSSQQLEVIPETIAEALMWKWLGAYVAAQACGDRKLGEFKVDSVQVSSQQPDTYVMGVTYSVKPTSESKPAWLMAQDGKLGSDGWIVGKFVVLHVKKQGTEYTVTKATTAP